MLHLWSSRRTVEDLNKLNKINQHCSGRIFLHIFLLCFTLFFAIYKKP